MNRTRIASNAYAGGLLALCLTSGAAAQSCTADLNGDGQVNGSDLSVVLAGWGSCEAGSSCHGDINGDGSVGGTDLTAVLSGWGQCVIVTPSWATLVEATPDPSVVADVTLRAAIISTGYAWRVRDTVTQIEMVLIPPGTFQMGCSASNTTACNVSESPIHPVEVTSAFYMGRYEVTQAQWTSIMGVNPSVFSSPSPPWVPASQVPNRPVESASWSTIQHFLNRTVMRLPTEAEWEYAYRAGTTTAFHSMPGHPSGTDDSSLLGNIAWFSGNASQHTRPVGQKAGNGFGLHDMSGNVWEWVSDWYSESYYMSSPVKDPLGPSSGTLRVARGGGWNNTASSGAGRSSHRASGYASANYHTAGLRVVRTPVNPPPVLTLVTPESGPVSGNKAMVLTGMNLAGAISVAVGGVAATDLQVVSSTAVTVVSPPGTVGPRDVTVTTPDGTVTLENGFTYTDDPIVAAVLPASGPVQGGTLITLTGTNLGGATTVTVDGVRATSVQVVSETMVTAVTPAGVAGVRDVRLTTPGGTATRTGGFTYGDVSVPTWATLIEADPDPAVVTDAKLRAAIMATGLAWRVLDTETQIEMMLIPPGTFRMGCSPSSQFGCEVHENPLHVVTLTNAFYLGRYEVTQAQWTARMGSNPSQFQSPSAQVPAEQIPNRPVEQVSWIMIQDFLRGTGLRLPTEAEWEYAHRAGTTTAFHSMPGYPSGTDDDSLLGNIAWISGNSLYQTRPVGQKAGNGFGLHDMSGNVWEWVDDWYSGNYYAVSSVIDPTGPALGWEHVLRGGGGNYGSRYCRSSDRHRWDPFSSGPGYFGLRVAKTP